MKLGERLRSLHDVQHVPVVVRFNPRPGLLPLPAQRYDEPLLPLGREIIKATKHIVCGYCFNLAAYLAWGAAGMIALERTVALVDYPLLRILHGPFASADYALAAFESPFGFDAVTLANRMPLDAYSTYSDRGAFVLSEDLPETVTDDAGIYLQQLGVLALGNVDRGTWMQLTLIDALLGGRGDDFASHLAQIIVEQFSG